MSQSKKEKIAATFPAESQKPVTEKLRPSTPERVPSLEAEITDGRGNNLEPKERSIDRTIESLKQLVRRPKKTSTGIPQIRDEITVRVEKIMEENLADAYRALSPLQRQEFKIKGEKTAQAVRQLLNKTRVQIKKIFRLILEWLLILPGINRFYLEQEAKIKADRILALKNHIHDRM